MNSEPSASLSSQTGKKPAKEAEMGRGNHEIRNV